MKAMYLLTEYATDNFGKSYEMKIVCSTRVFAELKCREDRKASTEIENTKIEEVAFYK